MMKECEFQGGAEEGGGTGAGGGGGGGGGGRGGGGGGGGAGPGEGEGCSLCKFGQKGLVCLPFVAASTGGPSWGGELDQ